MTESHPAEQTNALLAAVVASSMDAVFSTDANARIQTWNLAAEKLYGYTAAEAIGRPLGFLAPDPASYTPGTGFRRVLQGEQIYFEASRRRVKPIVSRFVVFRPDALVQSDVVGDGLVEPIVKAHAGAAGSLHRGVAGPPLDARDIPRRNSIHVLDHSSEAANRRINGGDAAE